jgi:hypothetical protein
MPIEFGRVDAQLLFSLRQTIHQPMPVQAAGGEANHFLRRACERGVGKEAPHGFFHQRARLLPGIHFPAPPVPNVPPAHLIAVPKILPLGRHKPVRIPAIAEVFCGGHFRRRPRKGKNRSSGTTGFIRRCVAGFRREREDFAGALFQRVARVAPVLVVTGFVKTVVAENTIGRHEHACLAVRRNKYALGQSPFRST